MNIYEHHEIKGWFFLPEDPDNRVPGVLKWDPAKGAEIELMGGFFPGFYYDSTLSEGMSNIRSGIIRPADDVSSIPVMFLKSREGKMYSIWEAYSGVLNYNPATR